jgi:hypothetical protein
MNRKQELKEQLKEIAHTHHTLQQEYDELCVLDKWGSVENLLSKYYMLLEEHQQLVISGVRKVRTLEDDVWWYKRLCMAWATLTFVLLIIVVVMG